MENDKYLAEYNQWRESQGLPRLAAKPAEKKQRAVWLSDEAWQGLSDLAARDKHHSINAWLEAVGTGVIDV